MTSVAEALAAVIDAARPLGVERVGLGDALGRVLGTDAVADLDLPPFDNSQMDGFAVRGADLAGASVAAPVALRVAGTIAAGAPPGGALAPGSALRIMTGAALPAGADAVVKVEDAVFADGVVRVAFAPAPGEFVRPAGEDVRVGERVLGRGRVLGPADLGMLAALGRPAVDVAIRPRVAVLSTGDEIVEVGRPLRPGTIHNSNAHALAAACRAAGADPVVLPIVPDERAALRRSLEVASRFDFALSTGGVSVGDFDHVKDVMDEIGMERVFWRVAQKPGKPLTFARRAGNLFFGLPGNPVSALVCFHVYVVPALRRALGRDDLHLPAVEVEIAADIPVARDLTEFVRCTLDHAANPPVARATGTQSSGALRSMSLADALVVAPPGVARLAAGARATALLLRGAPDMATHPF